MNQSPSLEVCLESFESALAAEQGGAQRIELCADLLEGGTTPSAGMIRTVRKHLQIVIQVMIRPRGGDFLYTDAEYEMMRHDIQIAKDLGADGIVLGLLNPNGTIDLERTRELVELSGPLPVTFHRAIDVSRDLPESLEAIIATGAARVLSSGGRPSVVDGADTVAQMVEQAGNRIVIMPGCGIDRDNILDVKRRTNAREFHIALDHPVQSDMMFRKAEIPMGDVEGREYLRFVTEAQAVRDVVTLLQNASS